MAMHNDGTRTEGRSVWMFMAATAMATTVSTLAATAMVKADSAEATDSTQAVKVTCECEAAESSCPAPTPVSAETKAPQGAPTPATEAPVVSGSAPAESATKETITVEGPLDKAIIRRIVRAHIDEVRYCYNEGLAKNPELGGRVMVQIRIGSEGKVVDSKVTSSDLEDDEVAECIAEAAGRWTFPKPPGNEEAVVQYPFVLEPG